MHTHDGLWHRKRGDDQRRRLAAVARRPIIQTVVPSSDWSLHKCEHRLLHRPGMSMLNEHWCRRRNVLWALISVLGSKRHRRKIPGWVVLVLLTLSCLGHSRRAESHITSANWQSVRANILLEHRDLWKADREHLCGIEDAVFLFNSRIGYDHTNRELVSFPRAVQRSVVGWIEPALARHAG